MTEPNARVILDSRHPHGGPRVTTLEVTMHRYVLAEFNTHRMFSRNAASSRAIPAKKMIHRVAEDPAMPTSWPREQSGMQGGPELTGDTLREAMDTVHALRLDAISAVDHLVALGLHKSVANRYLEPWGWVTDLVTATEWDNFWALRCNRLAQPELRLAAEAMRAAYEESRPLEVAMGDWHLPLVDGVDLYEILMRYGETVGYENAKKISAARCSRVSYLTHEGTRDWAKDLEHFERLKHPGEGPMHASPFEHVCTPLPELGIQRGNLTGWRQYRHDVEEEVARGDVDRERATLEMR